MKLSIIIPNYNSIKTLRKLLYSIPPDEAIQVIVVTDIGDCETKEINELRNEVRDRPYLFLHNTSGCKGAGVCRNIGLQKAEGKWILFADADDYFTEGFYGMVSQYFNSNNDVVFFMVTSIDRETGDISNKQHHNNNIIKNYNQNKDLAEELDLRYRHCEPWSKLIRRELICNNEIGFDETIVSNDVMFSTKVGYYMKRFVVSEETIYCVTSSRGTLTKIYNSNIFWIRFNVFVHYYHFLKEHIGQKNLDMLSMHGLKYIAFAVLHELSLKEIGKVYQELRKNHIKLIVLRRLHFSWIVKMTKVLIGLFLGKRKYGTR